MPFCSYQHFWLWNFTFLLFSSSSKVYCLKIKTDIYRYSLSPSALLKHLDMCFSSIHSAHRIWPLFTSHFQIALSLLLRYLIPFTVSIQIHVTEPLISFIHCSSSYTVNWDSLFKQSSPLHMLLAGPYISLNYLSNGNGTMDLPEIPNDQKSVQ